MEMQMLGMPGMGMNMGSGMGVNMGSGVNMGYGVNMGMPGMGVSRDPVIGVHSSRGSANGRELHEGPRGGHYYMNANGNKTYVQK